MFILDAKDVIPCSVIKKAENSAQNQPGLSYRGKLFIQVGSYPLNQFKTAIQQCRQLLEGENPVTTIIVKTGKNTTVWSHDEQLIVKNRSIKANSKKLLFKLAF